MGERGLGCRLLCDVESQSFDSRLLCHVEHCLGSSGGAAESKVKSIPAERSMICSALHTMRVACCVTWIATSAATAVPQSEYVFT